MCLNVDYESFNFFLFSIISAFPPLIILICIHMTLWWFIFKRKFGSNYNHMARNQRNSSSSAIETNTVQCRSESPINMLMALNIIDCIKWIGFLSLILGSYWSIMIDEYDSIGQDRILLLRLFDLTVYLANCCYPFIYFKFHTDFRSTVNGIFKKVRLFWKMKNKVLKYFCSLFSLD